MYKEKAIEKIQKELKAFTGGNKEKAVSKPVAETLEMFASKTKNSRKLYTRVTRPFRIAAKR